MQVKIHNILYNCHPWQVYISSKLRSIFNCVQVSDQAARKNNACLLAFFSIYLLRPGYRHSMHVTLTQELKTRNPEFRSHSYGDSSSGLGKTLQFMFAKYLCVWRGWLVGWVCFFFCCCFVFVFFCVCFFVLFFKSSLKLLEHFEPEESAVIANYCCMLVVLMKMLFKPITTLQRSSRPVIIYLRI